MSIFKRKNIEQRSEEQSFDDSSLDVSLRASLGGTNVITREMAMQIPTFSACVNFIKNTVSTIPIKLYKAEEIDGKKKIVTINDYRCELLNNDTKDTLTGCQFKQSLVEDYIFGGGYAYINRDMNTVKSLNYVRNDYISVSNNSNPIFKDYYIYCYDKKYEPFEFLKVLRSTRNGSEGRSIIDDNNLLLKVSYNSLVFENSLVSKGGNKKGFLKSSKKLTTEMMQVLKSAWRNLYSNNEDNVVVLNDGLEFQESSNTSTEMQLNENKIANAKEICKIFNICPETISGGVAGVEDFYLQTFKTCIMPILEEITQSINRDLLLESEKDSYFFAFDTNETLKGDTQKRYSAYQTAVNSGWISKNEIREKENLESIDGLDIITLSLGNVIFNTETKEIYTPNTDVVLGKGKGVEQDAS